MKCSGKIFLRALNASITLSAWTSFKWARARVCECFKCLPGARWEAESSGINLTPILGVFPEVAYVFLLHSPVPGFYVSGLWELCRDADGTAACCLLVVCGEGKTPPLLTPSWGAFLCRFYKQLAMTLYLRLSTVRSKAETYRAWKK